MLKKRKPISEYHRQRIAESNRNRVWSEESRQKQKDRNFSEETKAKIRLARMNQKNLNLVGMKGKKHTLESLKKIGDSSRGRRFTKEHKKKLSQSRIGRFGGANSPCWKGGISILGVEIRNTFNHRQWRSDVFYRDNYTCVWCGAKKNIEADHIKSFSVIMREYNIKSVEEALLCEELWNINNGRTLCKPCHKTTDTYGNKNKNTYGKNITV